MARQSRLPSGGENLFQKIKRQSAEAEAGGIQLLNLSIGQPRGPALMSAREVASRVVLSDEEAVHEYQDNGSPGKPGLAERFVKAIIGHRVQGDGLDYLPIPGIKPMLGLIPLACGCADNLINVATTTDPGYPTPADWCGYHPLVVHQSLRLDENNDFRLSSQDPIESLDLVMVNYPHNPSGQVATEESWRDLCTYCSKYNIRLFNDAAYAPLVHSSEACTLTEVACDFPELSWVEAFSASKAIGNGTGWRVGAMVGSSDFIGDIARIKGNTDSGFVLPMAVGALVALEGDKEGIARHREMYRVRLEILIQILESSGMKLAVRPGAGFFTLWQVPTHVFGEEVEGPEHFNTLMISRTGVVGVPFDPSYIRYAVCGDIQKMKGELQTAFEDADVSYR